MINLKLNPNHDLVIENYGLARVSGIDQIAQRIKTRLQLFFSEWFLDRTIGVPWLTQILVKNPRESVVQGVLKRTILSTPGVNELLEFSILALENRISRISFTVSSSQGIFSDEIEVSL